MCFGKKRMLQLVIGDGEEVGRPSTSRLLHSFSVLVLSLSDESYTIRRKNHWLVNGPDTFVSQDVIDTMISTN